MPGSNALETYRRIIRIKLMLSLMIALTLILIGIYYFFAARG